MSLRETRPHLQCVSCVRHVKLETLTVGPVAGLVAHECKVALVRLDYSGRLQVVLGEAVDDLVELGDLFIETGQVDIAAFDSVAVAVQGVIAFVFVVLEHAKVLRPVPKRCSRIDELIGTGDVVGDSQTLKEPTVGFVVGVPPHLGSANQHRAPPQGCDKFFDSHDIDPKVPNRPPWDVV